MRKILLGIDYIEKIISLQQNTDGARIMRGGILITDGSTRGLHRLGRKQADVCYRHNAIQPGLLLFYLPVACPY